MIPELHFCSLSLYYVHHVAKVFQSGKQPNQSQPKVSNVLTPRPLLYLCTLCCIHGQMKKIGYIHYNVHNLLARPAARDGRARAKSGLKQISK